MAPSLISGGDDAPTRPAALTVAELTRNHTGKRVRIEHDGLDAWALEGRLYGVRHEEEKTELRAFAGDELVRVKTHVQTWIVVGPAEVAAAGTERVTFL